MHPARKKAKKAPNPYVVRGNGRVDHRLRLSWRFCFARLCRSVCDTDGIHGPDVDGAHKDTVCEHCGALYQSTASSEYDNENRNSLTDVVAVASTCAMCRATNAFRFSWASESLDFFW